MATPTFVSVGAAAVGTTSLSIAYAASLAAGNKLIMFVHTDGSAVSTPTGWTSGGSLESGGGSNTAIFFKDSTGSETGSNAVTITGGTVSTGYVSQYAPATGGDTLTPFVSGAADTDTTTTAINIIGASTAAVSGDAMIVGWNAVPASGTFSSTATGQGLHYTNSVTITGVTSRTNNKNAGSTMCYGLADGVIGTGGTGLPSYTATAVGANASGAAYVVLLRESTPARPTAAFTITGTSALTATFDGTSSTAQGAATIASYAWSFGDGVGTSTSATPSYTYTAGGTFTVSLTVTDSLSVTSTPTTHNVTVTAAAGNVGSASTPTITSWTPSSGTVLSCINDTDPTTFATSATGPTNQVLGLQPLPLSLPTSGFPMVVAVNCDFNGTGTSGSVIATLVDNGVLKSTATTVALSAGSGGSVVSWVFCQFPYTDISGITSADWTNGKLVVNLSFTAA